MLADAWPAAAHSHRKVRGARSPETRGRSAAGCLGHDTSPAAADRPLKAAETWT